MKKIIVTITILTMSGLVLLGCNNEQADVNTTNSMDSNANLMVDTNTVNSTAVVSEDDKEFMTKAAQDGMAEVKLATMAKDKAQNADVKKFAQKMIEDHTKANAELKELANKKNIALPADVNENQKEMADELAKLSGKEFDEKYVEMMVAAHEKSVDLFQSEADDGKNADAKAFAAKTLPTLKEHLSMIKEIDEKM